MDTTHLDGLVPATGRKHAALWRFNPAQDTDRRVVLSDLRRLASGHVEHPPRIVCATVENLGPVLREVRVESIVSRSTGHSISHSYLVPTYIQHWPLVGIHGFALGLPVRADFVNTNLTVMRCSEHERNQRSRWTDIIVP